jgi:tetratricopeptide (TPR) repeat protein
MYTGSEGLSLQANFVILGLLCLEMLSFITRFNISGRILENLNDLDRAEKQYKKGLEIDPNNIDILINLVNFYLNKKEQGLDDGSPSCWVKARQYYLKARNFLKDELNKLEDAETLLNLAKLHLSMDEYEEAESYLLKALEKDSGVADIYTSLATLSVSKENFREAANYFKKALKIAPDDLDVWSNLAQAYLKLKQLSQAESEYRKILSIAPCHVESHIGLGEVYIEMGDEGESDLYSQAIKHFDKAIKISNEREGSKILNKKELSGIYYLRGYARVKIYENPVGIKDSYLLLEAQGDFAKCIDKDPENYKGITAHKKLEKQMEIQTIQSFTTVFGSGIIWFSSILILGITNLVFWQPFLSNNQNNKVSVSQPSPQPIKTPKPNASPNSKNSTQSQTKIGVNKTSEPNRINTTEYFLLTFGSLTFSLISLYLPQLLKLKIGGTGIEIEKSSIDQIKTSQIPTSLGIKK